MGIRRRLTCLFTPLQGRADYSPSLRPRNLLASVWFQHDWAWPHRGWRGGLSRKRERLPAPDPLAAAPASTAATGAGSTAGRTPGWRSQRCAARPAPCETWVGCGIWACMREGKLAPAAGGRSYRTATLTTKRSPYCAARTCASIPHRRKRSSQLGLAAAHRGMALLCVCKDGAAAVSDHGSRSTFQS